MKQQVLLVPDVHCGHCVSSIEGAVGALTGVQEVKVDLGRKDVTVVFDDARVGLDAITAAIEEQGYDIDSSGGGGLLQIGERP